MNPCFNATYESYSACDDTSCSTGTLDATQHAIQNLINGESLLPFAACSNVYSLQFLQPTYFRFSQRYTVSVYLCVFAGMKNGKGTVPLLDLVDQSAIINQDLDSVLARLTKHMCQPAADKSDPHLPDILSAVGATASALLEECFSLAVGICDVWARDGQKGARSLRKKGLVDSIKSLVDLGKVLMYRVCMVLIWDACLQQC